MSSSLASSRRFVRRWIAVAMCAAVSATAYGQSINIDFGDEIGPVDSSYAGAGLAGIWNTLSGPVDTPAALVGLDGAPTAVTVTVGGALDTLADIPLAHPEIGVHRPLLGDGLLGAFGPEFPVNIGLENLANGLYRVITYTWHWPGEAYAQATFNDQSSFVHPAGGPWPGGPIAGVTHIVQVSKVTNGRIGLQVVGDGPGAFFNGSIFIQGIQLWKIDEPIPCNADTDGDTVVDVDDLVDVIVNWGTNDPGADIDGSGTVDVDDLVLVILNWGPCPGSVTADCRDGNLGDCLVPHAGPGCDYAPCCELMCGLDPFCCNVTWDAACAETASILPDCRGTHPNCVSNTRDDCSVNHTPPGCSDTECCSIVCQMEPFCCNYAWDAICAAVADLYCGKLPAGCGHPGAGPCFDAIGVDQNYTPYCDDETCCETVCAIAPQCCTEPWDATCVALAHANCAGGTCGAGADDCFAVHRTPGCNDAECCAAVCDIVPFCCDFDGEWAQVCVDWAQLMCAQPE